MDDSNGLSFELYADISDLYPFSKEDGSDPVAELIIKNETPTTAIAALHSLVHTIENDNEYIVKTFFEHTKHRDDIEPAQSPDELRHQIEDMTRWITVPFQTLVDEELGPREITINVTAPGYGLILQSLSHFLYESNIEEVTNRVLHDIEFTDDFDISEIDDID